MLELKKQFEEAANDPEIQREFEEMGKRISGPQTWRAGDLIWDPEDDDVPVDNVDNVDNTTGCTPMDNVGSVFSFDNFVSDLTPNDPDKIEIGREENR